MTYRAADSYDFTTWNSSVADKKKTFFAVGDGYIAIRPAADGIDTNGYLQLLGAAYSSSADHSLQMTVMTAGLLGGQPVSFMGVRINGSTDSNSSSSTYKNYNFSSFSSGFTQTGSGTVKNLTSWSTNTTSLTFTLLNTADTDTYKLVSPTATYLSRTGTYTANSGWTGIGWNSGAPDMRIYALRYYTADLTDTQRAQNHFADLAKFFRLNLTGFDVLTEARKQDVYEAALGFDLSGKREGIQQAISELILPYISEGYEAMKGEDAAKNAMIDLAADYLLDLSELFASTRDMSSVYGAIDTLSVAMAGKTVAGAQAALDEAIFDAYYYLSYRDPGICV